MALNYYLEQRTFHVLPFDTLYAQNTINQHLTDQICPLHGHTHFQSTNETDQSSNLGLNTNTQHEVANLRL